VRDAGEVAKDGVEGCGGVEEGRGKGAEARRELGVEAGVGGLEEPAAEFCIGDGGAWWWWSMGKEEGIWGSRGRKEGGRLLTVTGGVGGEGFYSHCCFSDALRAPALFLSPPPLRVRA
jgi:hypothetical protein